MKGKAFKFGDNISTDHIAPGRLFHLRSDLQEFAKHVLEDADENFAKNMNKGDFVVAGNNFGLGLPENMHRKYKNCPALELLLPSLLQEFFTAMPLT